MNRQICHFACLVAVLSLTAGLKFLQAQERNTNSDARGKLRPALAVKSKMTARKAATPSTVIREPSQGRPIFVTPGDAFYFVMDLPPNFKGDVGFALQHALEPSIQLPLKPKTPPTYVEQYFHLVLEVVPDVEPGLYDLKVRTNTMTYYSRHSVKVVDKFKDKFRFVHLSNMNIGDLTAPEFDEMLPQEINLLAPEFVVATGDYTEWARVLDDPSSWQRVLNYFKKFNTPVFMLCGSHDHEASFTRFVASKPMGLIEYGNYHGLLLLDHPGNPIDQDYAQIQWVERELKQNRTKRMNFIVANSDELGLIDVWRERGNLTNFIREHKVRMYIAGGSTDWDYKEFADKLDGLDNMHFIRTHQSSTCLRDRATGFSHYRVVEIDGDKVTYVYPNDTAAEMLQHSIPTGRLRAHYDAPNDGTAGRIGVTIRNALNQRFDEARLWLRVAKGGSEQPKIAPGRPVRILDAGDYWACEIACDLPDKGAVHVVASTSPSDVPPPLPIAVKLDSSSQWSFTPRVTDFGLAYFESNDSPRISLTNQSKANVTCWPVIRINGAQLHADRSAVSRMPLTLKPGQTMSIPLVLNLRRVSPGEHKLQVHFLEDPLSRLHTFDVNLSLQGIASNQMGRMTEMLDN